MDKCVEMVEAKVVSVSDYATTMLRRQGHKMVLHHSAVKPCHWFREAMMRGRTCYKHRFYGIPTWRCLQMTPTASFCNFQCLYCWRLNTSDVPPMLRWKEVPEDGSTWDDPEEIVDESIRVHRIFVQGYKGVRVFKRAWTYQAEKPAHAAISLTGEPTLYPRIGELIGAYKRRGMTTFLVTNGSIPERLEGIETEPSQLYVTVPACEEGMYKRITKPLWPDAWQRLLATLDLLESFSCPSVMRITLIKGLNLKYQEEFAKLVDRYNPTYVEPKAYIYVGYSRRRLSYEASPSHSEIRKFGEEIAEYSGYNVLDEARESKIVLLSRLQKPIRLSPGELRG